MKANIGLIGLAVMGENLVLNMESKGFSVAVYNRSIAKVDAFLDSRAKGKNIIGTHSLEELVENLERPGKSNDDGEGRNAVDETIEKAHPPPGSRRYHH